MFRIAFDFDENEKVCSNFRIVEVEQPKVEKFYSADISVETHSLQLYPKAVQEMNLKPGDRVSVQYISEGVGKSAPVIGKAEAFTDPLDGNRVSSLFTVSFRGQKRETLLQFGRRFDLEPYAEGMWKLVHPKPRTKPKQDDIEPDEEDLENLNPVELDTELTNIFNTISIN